MGRETGIVEIRSSADAHMLRQFSLHGAALRAVAQASHRAPPRQRKRRAAAG